MTGACAHSHSFPIASSNSPSFRRRRRLAAGEVQIRVRAVALNHIDVWGWRGMAFAKRKMPLVVGAEAAGEIAGVGPEVTGFKPGDPVVMFGALTCGVCKACREGRDNLCENVAGVMGFHVDGFARELVNMPARLVIPVPGGIAARDAACAPIAFATVQHMLFDNAKLEPGETVLVHAGGSGIGTAAIKMAKAIGATVITTIGDDAKAEKAKALGADHVINYRTERFEGVVRKLTAKKGVDVVFEHVGAETFNGSLLCLKRGGRLVTCGATSGPSTTLNLMQLFQQQYRIIGSFGASMRNIRESLAKMAAGMLPVIDTEVDSRRCRTRPGTAREPPGVRQDRRHVLRANTPSDESSVATLRAHRPSSPQGGGRRRRRMDHGRVAARTAPYRPPPHGQWQRSGAPPCRPVATGASHRPRQPDCRLPRKTSGGDRKHISRVMGQSRPCRRGVRPPRHASRARRRAARAG